MPFECCFVIFATLHCTMVYGLSLWKQDQMAYIGPRVDTSDSDILVFWSFEKQFGDVLHILHVLHILLILHIFHNQTPIVISFVSGFPFIFLCLCICFCICLCICLCICKLVPIWIADLMSFQKIYDFRGP